MTKHRMPRKYTSSASQMALVDGIRALGHSDPDGGSSRLNAFGNDFHSHGKKWTTTLCKMDSDGDGQTNGQALGDPCCVWVQNANDNVQWTSGVPDPGDRTSVSDAFLWANTFCENPRSPSVKKLAALRLVSTCIRHRSIQSTSQSAAGIAKMIAPCRVYVLALLYGSVAMVAAKPEFVDRVPNGNKVKGVRAIGHSVPKGSNSKLNEFGVSFRNQGEKWTKALCMTDSDGDGQTNGQELGDPCCVWTQRTDEKVQWSTDVSDPGNKSSVSDASRWANVSCGNMINDGIDTQTTATSSAAAKRV
ncbi:TPA: hypothetical protein N0F65_005217, partial [Lagenidium giganteum]